MTVCPYEVFELRGLTTKERSNLRFRGPGPVCDPRPSVGNNPPDRRLACLRTVCHGMPREHHQACIEGRPSVIRQHEHRMTVTDSRSVNDRDAPATQQEIARSRRKWATQLCTSLRNDESGCSPRRTRPNRGDDRHQIAQAARPVTGCQDCLRVDTLADERLGDQTTVVERECANEPS